MSNPNRLFADISSNNSEFNAAEYARAGHRAVAIKATEGTAFVNPDHGEWCLHAGLHHLAVIHYHLARPDLGDGPEAEADHFLSVALRLAGGRDYLVCDIERATPQGWSHDPAWTRTFDEYVQAHCRFHTVLYASESDLMTSDEWLHGDKRRAWVAAWSSNPVSVPQGYGLFGRQFTDGFIGPEPHSLAGVGRCDVSYLSNRTLGAILHRG